MKIVRNFLDPQTLDYVIKQYYVKLNSDNTTAKTNLSWDPGIVAHSGIVHICDVPELSNTIKSEICKLLPNLPSHNLFTMF